MAILLDSALLAEAATIQGETGDGLNTADRIGAMFTDIIDSKLQTAKVTLSSAQILTLNGTPIQLVAAQGANTIIIPVKVLFYEHFVTTAYTTNTTLQIAPGTVYSKSFSSELAFTQSQLSAIEYSITAAGTTPANSINVPINIFVTGANPVAGDGTVDVYLTYKVIAL